MTLAPNLLRHGERAGAQPVLERPGRVARFVLDPDVAQTERRRVQQRRVALAQGHGLVGGGVQEAVPAPHRAAVAADGVALCSDTGHSIVDDGEVGGRPSGPAGRAILGIVIDRVTGAATNAGERSGLGHDAAHVGGLRPGRQPPEPSPFKCSGVDASCSCSLSATKWLSDSHISYREGDAVFDGGEPSEADAHDLRSRLSVIAGPSSESGDDP